jgi:hypothetical protein
MRAVAFFAVVLLCGATSLTADEFMPELREPPESKPARLPSTLGSINSTDEWEQRRAKLRSEWAEVIGRFPERVPLEAQVVSTEALPDHTRTLVRYRTDPASRTRRPPMRRTS